MSHFLFKDSDFDSSATLASASSKNTKNYTSNDPLKTTRALSNTTRFMTTYNLADILQGAALYKPEALALETLDATLTGSFSGLLAGEEAAGMFVGPGREAFTPGLNRGYTNLTNQNPVMVEALRRSGEAAFSTIHPSDVDRVANIDGDGFAPQEFVQYGNGRIPVSALTPLEGQASHHRLWAEAAQAFNMMREEMLSAGFTDPFVNSSYRTYEKQWQLKWDQDKDGIKDATPNKWAATPGGSKYGWGIAIDWQPSLYKEGHLQYNDAGQTGLEWLNQNAHKYGFVHPAWARPTGSLPEPWHWEYRGHLV